MQTDSHVAFCQTPLGQCVACMAVYRRIKKVIAAVEPVIAEQVTKPLKERLDAAELVCNLFGISPAHTETEREKAATQAWMDWFNQYGRHNNLPADEAIVELAARRDEIRARTLEAIRHDQEPAAGELEGATQQ